MTDHRKPIIESWRGCPFVPFSNLPPDAQREARETFSPHGRRNGWQHIENWAFALRKDGRLAKTPYIEPLYGDRRVPPCE